jgi:hypothetical protein
MVCFASGPVVRQTIMAERSVRVELSTLWKPLSKGRCLASGPPPSFPLAPSAWPPTYGMVPLTFREGLPPLVNPL